MTDRHHFPLRWVARLSLAGALLISSPSWSGGSDWPQFRGPDRTGVGTDTDLAGNWPAEGPPVRWAIDTIGAGYGAVAQVGERLYVQGTAEDQSVVFALSTRDGSEIWRRALGPLREQDQGPGPRSVPTVVGDGVYVLNEGGELAYLDAASGEVRWQFNVLERFEVPNIYWSVSESPLVDGDRIFLMPGGDAGSIVALERATGETAWRSTEVSDPMSYASLVTMDLEGTRAIVGFTQAAGIGVRASDGKLLWRYEAPANRTANAAAPVVADDLVFYSSSYGTGGGAVRPSVDGEDEEVWFKSSLQNHHGGVVYYRGHLYGFFGPALACVEAATGEIKWRARSVGKGSLSIADGKLYLFSERRRVAVADASPEGYREGGRFEVTDRDWPTWAYPVVTNGTLYIRNQNELTAYDVSASIEP